jgi:hypothetical protein
VFSVKYLLAAGANPKASAVEWSAASLACAEDSAEVLAMLIRAGCVVDHGGERGDTPLARALCVGGTKCVAMLLEAGCDVGWVDDDGRGVLDLAKYCEATYKSERHGICLGMIEADLERRNLMIVAGGPNDAKPTRRM